MSLPAHADVILGLTAGVDLWNVESSGSLSDTSEDDMYSFDLGSERKGVLSLALEHPIPLIPNFKIRTNDLSAEDQVLLSENFRYAGADYQVNSQVDVEFDVRNTDYVLYYELLDNDLIAFDFGLNFKHLDGNIRVESQREDLASQDHFTGYVPMLYGAAQLGIPATRLSFYGDLNLLSINGDHTLQDYQAGVAYAVVESLPLDIRLKGGYRRFSLELDDLDGTYTDWDFEGAYLGLEVDF
jgi:outer membrane protein